MLNLGISLTVPTFMGLTAQHARDDEVGEVMGIANGIISLSNALIPVLAATAFGFLGASLYHVLAVLPLTALFLSRDMQVPAGPSREQSP